MKEYNTEEYFKKHGFADGGYVNKCEPKFRKEFFCEFPKEPNFSMIKPTYNINDIVRGHNRDINYLIIGIVFAYNLGEAEYTLQNIDTKETHYNIPEYLIFGLVRSPKFKLGDIVKWTGYKDIDFKITSIILDEGGAFCYSLEATSGVCGCNRVREEELTLVTEYEINMNVNLESSHWTGGTVPSCEKIVSSKNNITEEELSKAIVLYKTLKTI